MRACVRACVCVCVCVCVCLHVRGLGIAVLVCACVHHVWGEVDLSTVAKEGCARRVVRGDGEGDCAPGLMTWYYNAGVYAYICVCAYMCVCLHVCWVD